MSDFFVMLNVRFFIVMLKVAYFSVILNVRFLIVMLSVVAPIEAQNSKLFYECSLQL